MTEPEDGVSRPPSSQPPDTRGAGLPPRLREKLLEAEEKGAGGGGGSQAIGLIITVVVIAAIVGGVWWMLSAEQAKKKAEAARIAAGARAVAIADSLDAVARADSLAAAARADSIAFAALPKSQQRKLLAERAKKLASNSSASTATTTTSTTTTAPASSGSSASATATPPAAKPATGTAAAKPPAPAAEPTAPKEKGPFAIDAGHYLDQARANEVAEALKAKAKLPTQVVSVGEGDAAVFHVFVGSFSSRAAADAAANRLLEQGAVEQAGVVPLPKSP